MGRLQRFTSSSLTPLFGALVLAAGCGTTSSTENPDFSVPTDATVPADLTVIHDLTKGEDGAVDMAVDLSVPPDMVDLTDLSIPPDLLPLPPDFRPPPDLIVLPDFAPPSDFSGEPDLVNPRTEFQYVLNSLSVPQNPQQAAYNWDNTGPKNAFANLLTAITRYSIDIQTSVDTSVSQGQMIELMELSTLDPMRMNDGSPFFIARPGVAKPNPDYSGVGMFGIDQNSTQSYYSIAGLQNARLATFNISNGPQPVDLKLNLFLFGASPTIITLHASHFEATCGIDPKSQAPGLLSGQINGVLAQADLDKIVVPAVSAALNDAIKNQGPGANQILADLDKGNCLTNGKVAMPGDKIIDDCEVTQDPIFADALKLDVAIYNQMGKYMPDGNNPNKDSYTVGVAFTGVQAMWK